jgi:hypothetical protein
MNRNQADNENNIIGAKVTKDLFDDVQIVEMIYL